MGRGLELFIIIIIVIIIKNFSFFPETYPRFLLALDVANAGSCVGPQNKVGHPTRCRFSCWVPVEYK